MATAPITCKVGKTIPLMNIVQSYLMYSNQGDSEKYLATYLKMAMDVYSELNFKILTSEIRKIITINKKLGTITLPDDMLYWAQISVIDDDNNVIPLIENDATLVPYEEEIVAESGCPNPNCSSDLCSSVNSITAVSETVNISGVDHTNITKTQLLPDGSIIEEICKWYALGGVFYDYSVSGFGINVWYTVQSIKINGVDFVVNIPTTDGILAIQTALNGLGYGTFVVTEDGGVITIISLNNDNILESVFITNGFGPNETHLFTSSNATSAEKICETKQICKVELNKDQCIVETPENIAIVNETCFCVKPCEKVKKLLPTIHVNDGVVYFSNTNYDKVVLTYKTTGINFGVELMVPVVAERAMISGLAFFALKHRKNVSMNEKESARKYYDIDKQKLIEVLNPLRIQELMNAARITRVIW
jgi:hypothetical protein